MKIYMVMALLTASAITFYSCHSGHSHGESDAQNENKVQQTHDEHASHDEHSEHDSLEEHDEHDGHNHATHDEHDGHNHASHDGHNHATHDEHDEHDGHNHASHDGHNHGASGAEVEADPDEIIFHTEKAEAIGLEVETVNPGFFAQVIKTSGQVLSAQGDESVIVATSSGVIRYSDAVLTDGSAVNRGEAVFYISAQNMAEGDPAAKIRIEYEAAQKEYLRAEALVKDQIISARDFEQIKQRYEMAKATYEGAGLGAASRKSNGGIAVVSPISGYIKNRMVKQGDYVTAGQPVATVSQNRRLQLRAEVSERYFGQLQGIGSAHFKMPYDASKVYRLSDLNGRLLSFGKASADEAFYIPVTFEFDNIGQIVPGSFAEIYLLGQQRDNVISVPVTALVEVQGLYYVMLQLDAEGYKKQEVQLGANDGHRVEITAGLKAGDKVVTKGALQVKLAANAAAIPAHNHAH